MVTHAYSLAPGHALVGGLEGVGQRAEEGVDGDALVLRQRGQRLAEVDGAHACPAFFLSGLAALPHSKVVRARSMSS